MGAPEFAKLNIADITRNEKISYFSYLCTSTVIRRPESILLKVGPPLEKISGSAPEILLCSVVHSNLTTFILIFISKLIRSNFLRFLASNSAPPVCTAPYPLMCTWARWEGGVTPVILDGD